MSDFKFNCPSCGQHLSGDERYSGLQITCPACRTPVVVPSAPAATLGVRMVSAAPPAPPRAAAPTAQNRTSGLAIASLVCSFIPLGCIPGIICGHMARKRIATLPGLKGAGLALAGLIISYIALGFHVLAVVSLIGAFMTVAGQVRQLSSPGATHVTIATSASGSEAPAEALTTDTAPDGSGWSMKLGGMEIPSGAVAGRIHGQPFKLEKVTLENGWLNFRQGGDFFADREIDVVVFESDTAKLSGRTITVPTKQSGSNPHIWMKWKEGTEDMPKQKSYMDRYALRLEFGALSGGKLPGKIYLCVPDKEKTFVAGTFVAEVKN